MSAKIQKQLAAISSRLAALEVRRRAAPTPPPAQQPRRRRRRARRNAVVQRNGDLDAVVRVTRRDILLTVDSDKLVHAPLHHNVLPGLHKFAGIYERITWHSAKVWWRPSLGTTEAGMVTYGIDWDLKGATDSLTRAQIALYTPSVSHAVWHDTSSKPTVLPASRLSSRKIMFFSQEASSIDGAPAALVALSSHPRGGGEFWIEYTVTLSGVHP